MLPDILKHVPDSFGTYYEPFIGGAAVWLALQPSHAVISDINDELTTLYQVVKDTPGALIKELKDAQYANSLQSFTAVRALDRDATAYKSLTPVQRAARTVYLNRTCFNGLYRVNSKNQFNVPYGKYTNPRILDEDNIKAFSELLNTNRTLIRHADYKTVLTSNVKAGDFVYLDPPYIPLTPTSSFTSYTRHGFGLAQQQELADVARTLDDAGVFVLASNSDTLLTRNLWKGFALNPIQVKRSISATTTGRGAAPELLMTGRTLSQHLTGRGA